MSHKELFWISLTIFLTIIAWMILDIYTVKTKTTVESGLESLQKVDFTIKSDILKILKEKTP